MRPAGRPTAVDPPSPAELIELGRIVNRHGIRGEVRLLPHCAESEVLAPGGELWLTRTAQLPERRRLIALRPHKRFLLLQLEGVVTANDAEALVGCAVAVPRARLPALADGAAYHVDLIGCSVRTTGGDPLGVVVEMIVTGSNDVCVVRDGQREYLIPLVADVIDTLDVAGRAIVVRPLPGLLDT